MQPGWQMKRQKNLWQKIAALPASPPFFCRRFFCRFNSYQPMPEWLSGRFYPRGGLLKKGDRRIQKTEKCCAPTFFCPSNLSVLFRPAWSNASLAAAQSVEICANLWTTLFNTFRAIENINGPNPEFIRFFRPQIFLSLFRGPRCTWWPEFWQIPLPTKTFRLTYPRSAPTVLVR